MDERSEDLLQSLRPQRLDFDPVFALARAFFFLSNAFVTCFWYHGNRNGHSTSLGEKAKVDDAVINKTLCFTMVKI